MIIINTNSCWTAPVTSERVIGQTLFGTGFFGVISLKTTCCNFLDTITGGANHLATADQESAEEEVDEGLHDSGLIFDQQA